MIKPDITTHSHKSSSSRPAFDFYEFIVAPSRFYPKWVVFGIVLGFLLCCIAGRLAARTNEFSNFNRFHRYINPTTDFYPTVSQMLSIVESTTTNDQVLVIVGGNSVFYGFGQNSADLWTDKLQRLLGANFKVFNFAMPSAGPFENGYWVAEALLKRHRKVIYLTDVSPATIGSPEGSDVYGYSFWDAREKRLLYHDEPRDMAVENSIVRHNHSKQQRIRELKLRMQLDSWLYFEDLWTNAAYSRFFTVWTELTERNPFAPRKSFLGETYELLPLDMRIKKEFVGAIKADYSLCFEPNSSSPRANFWAKMLDDLRHLIPATCRKNCLVVVTAPMPLFLTMIQPLEKERENSARALSQETWRLAGFHSEVMPDELVSLDYADGVHLAASGGSKLAESMSDSVRKLSLELGY